MPAQQVAQRFVDSADGARIAVYEGRLHLQRPAAALPPTNLRAGTQPGAALGYMAFFSIPVLAPLLIRLALPSKAIQYLLVKGIPREQIHHSASIASDAAYSVKTYRANYFATAQATTALPVGCRGYGAATPATGRQCHIRRWWRHRCTRSPT